MPATLLKLSIPPTTWEKFVPGPVHRLGKLHAYADCPSIANFPVPFRLVTSRQDFTLLAAQPGPSNPRKESHSIIVAFLKPGFLFPLGRGQHSEIAFKDHTLTF
jgi:hypothetical protein